MRHRQLLPACLTFRMVSPRYLATCDPWWTGTRYRRKMGGSYTSRWPQAPRRNMSTKSELPSGLHLKTTLKPEKVQPDENTLPWVHQNCRSLIARKDLSWLGTNKDSKILSSRYWSLQLTVNKQLSKQAIVLLHSDLPASGHKVTFRSPEGAHVQQSKSSTH